jgi:hypothetical protein
LKKPDPREWIGLFIGKNECLTVQDALAILIIMKNPNAVALGRLGGLRGGPARAARLTPTRRRQIAEGAAHARWERKIAGLDMVVRRDRWVKARWISKKTGADVEVVEQVLFMETMKPWERLARGLMRSRMGRAANV